MTKSQIFAISGAIILFFILYLGFDTIPPNLKDLEKSRLLSLESTSVNNLIQDAQAKLNTEQKSIIEAFLLLIVFRGYKTVR